MDCQFSIPTNYLGNAPAAGEPFQFATANCSGSVDGVQLISNSDTGAAFYLKETMSYGEIIIIFFLSFFLVITIFKLIWNFIFRGFEKL